MTALAFVLGIIAAFLSGYKYRDLKDTILSLQIALDKKQDIKPKEFKSNTSNSIIDPFDVVQRAKFEHDEEMRRLNPDA